MPRTPSFSDEEIKRLRLFVKWGSKEDALSQEGMDLLLNRLEAAEQYIALTDHTTGKPEWYAYDGWRKAAGKHD